MLNIISVLTSDNVGVWLCALCFVVLSEEIPILISALVLQTSVFIHSSINTRMFYHISLRYLAMLLKHTISAHCSLYNHIVVIFLLVMICLLTFIQFYAKISCSALQVSKPLSDVGLYIWMALTRIRFQICLGSIMP